MTEAALDGWPKDADETVEEYPPEPTRFWTYPPTQWEPRWWHRLGWPYFGADEWGRRTLVVGFGRVGYLCVVLWTCWCVDCHEGRAQTYEYAAAARRRHAQRVW